MYVYGEQTCVQIPEQQSDVAVSKALLHHFAVLGLSVLDLGPMYATDRQTDRQTDVRCQTDRRQARIIA